MATGSYFHLLGLPPRAALDEEHLQRAYLGATRTAHPDQANGDAALSAELNAAVEVLKSPVTRLRHLIETESETPWRAVSLDQTLMGLFDELAPLLQRGATFLNKKQSAASALTRALLASEEMRLREALESLNQQIEEQWNDLDQQLPLFDPRIEKDDSSVWSDLQAVQARFAYLSKWRAQIRELLLGLML
jgi:curved DNA-binding protein CbpA